MAVQIQIFHCKTQKGEGHEKKSSGVFILCPSHRYGFPYCLIRSIVFTKVMFKAPVDVDHTCTPDTYCSSFCVCWGKKRRQRSSTLWQAQFFEPPKKVACMENTGAGYHQR